VPGEVVQCCSITQKAQKAREEALKKDPRFKAFEEEREKEEKEAIEQQRKGAKQ